MNFAQGWAEQRLASTSARNGILNIHSVGEILNRVYRSRTIRQWMLLRFTVAKGSACPVCERSEHDPSN
jgi:hypothetical protein